MKGKLIIFICLCWIMTATLPLYGNGFTDYFKIENEEKIIQIEEISPISGEIYIYNNLFRNPFKRYTDPMEQEIEKEEEEEVNIDKLIKEKDLVLKGILGLEDRKLALIYTANGPIRIRQGESLDEFTFENIYPEKIEISYYQQTVYMKIGGEIIVN